MPRKRRKFDEWCQTLMFVVFIVTIASEDVVQAYTSSSLSSSSMSVPNTVINQWSRCRRNRSLHHKRHFHFETTSCFSTRSKQRISLPLYTTTSSLYSFFQRGNNNDQDNIIHIHDVTATENNKDIIDEEEVTVFERSNPRDQWYVSNMATTMVTTQAALIPIGIVLATMAGIDLHFLQFFRSNNGDNIIWLLGILSTIPLIIFAMVLDVFEKKVPAIQEVSEATLRSVYSLLGGSLKPFLALIIAGALGMIAGVGEEILFRGILQESIYQQHWSTINNDLDTVISIVLSSILFGLLHAATPLYVVLATIASLYFGTLYTLCNGDLTIPIICHSLYDIGALLYAHYQISQLPFLELQQLIIGESNGTRPTTSGANVE